MVLKKCCALVLSVGVSLFVCSCDTRNSESSVLQESITAVKESHHEESVYSTTTSTSSMPTSNYVSPSQSKYYYSVQNCDKYSVTDGWSPFEIAVPVPLENYLKDNTFSVRQLATDFGWKERDGYFYFDCQEMWVYFSFTHSSTADDDTSLDYLWGGRYFFAYPDSPSVFFYDFDCQHRAKTNNAEVHFNLDTSNAIYRIDYDDGIWASYDELVILLYMLTYVSIEPRYSPFEYDDFYWKYVVYPDYWKENNQVDTYRF